MKNFRFKTKEEFEQEFGENWRTSVPKTWIANMDRFLGQPLPNNKLRLAGRESVFTIDGFKFSPQMYTEVKPKYKNGVMTIQNGLLKSKY